MIQRFSPIFLTTLLLLAPWLQAADIAWKTSADGSFGTNTNWVGDVVPGSDDFAVFGPGGDYEVTLDQTRTIQAIRMDQGGTSNVTLNLGGHTLNMTDEFLISANTVEGAPLYTLILTNGSLNAQDDMRLANTGSYTGSMVIGSGATLTNSGGFRMSHSANAQSTVTVQDGGKWVVDSGNRVGGGAGSTGTINVTGSGSVVELEDGNGLTLGWNGTGILNITNGGEVKRISGNTNLSLGANGASSAGIITVSGENSLLDSGREVSVGGNGTGSVTVTDQGIFNGRDLSIGSASSPSGFVHISNQGSGSFRDIDMAGSMATLELNNGSLVSTRAGNWAANSTYRIFLNSVSATPLSMVDLSMGGAVLDVQLGSGFDAQLGGFYDILNYSGDLVGAFADLDQGDSIVIGDYVFEISYGTNPTGPDSWENGAVTLQLVAIPEPGIYALLAGLSALMLVLLRRRR